MKEEEIESLNIYLDTSVFVRENFIKGNKLNKLIELSEEEGITLLINSITRREVMSNLNEEYDRAITHLNQLETKCKILKNISNLNEVFNGLESFDQNIELDTLIQRIEKILDENFIDIPISVNSTEKIFKDYFDRQPPFGKGKKKSEFPDAYILSSIEDWCIKNNEKVYLLAIDGDMITFKSEHIIVTSDIAGLLDRISYTFSEKNKYQKVHGGLNTLTSFVLDQYKTQIESNFHSSGYSSESFTEYELHTVKVKSLEEQGINILYIQDEYAEVEMDVLIVIDAEVTYEDLSYGYYDREDGRWYNTDMVNTTLEVELHKKLTIEVELPTIGELTMDDLGIIHDTEIEIDELPLG